MKRKKLGRKIVIERPLVRYFARRRYRLAARRREFEMLQLSFGLDI